MAGKPSTNALTLDGVINFSIFANASNCQFSISCPLVFNDHGFITVSGANSLSIRGMISGPGGFSKAGDGTLLLSGIMANSYQGLTTISSGVLELNSGINLPFVFNFVSVPGNLLIGGASTNQTCAVRLLRNSQIAQTSAVTVQEGGLLDLNGATNAIGRLTIRGGVVHTGVSAPGLLTLNGNITNIYTTVTNRGVISGRLSLGLESRTFDVRSSSRLAIDAFISGVNVGIIKTGGGVLDLYNATNNYTVTTFINARFFIWVKSTIHREPSGVRPWMCSMSRAARFVR